MSRQLCRVVNLDRRQADYSLPAVLWRPFVLCLCSVLIGLVASTARAQEQQPTTPAAEPISTTLPAGAISWWRGELNANDAIGANHGTTTNGASFAPGFVGMAFSFDGVDDVVTIPDSTSLRLNPSSPRTIEAWAFRTSSATPVHLFGRRAGCAAPLDYYELAIGSNALPAASVPLNTWTHVAVTYDGTVQRHYINAVLVSEQTVAFLPGAASAPVLIGGSGTCPTFSGLIDELTLYNRTLSAQEIAAIHAAGSDGKTLPSGLVPTGLIATVNGSTISLVWNAVTGASSYRLRAGFAPGGSTAFDGNVGNITSLIAAASTGTYFVRVHAIVGGVESGPSNEVRIDIGGPACNLPAAPTQLTASVSSGAVSLTWSAVASVTSYVIEAGSSTGAANLASISTGNALTTFVALAPPGAYFVRVRARDACGIGAPSNEIIVLVGPS